MDSLRDCINRIPSLLTKIIDNKEVNIADTLNKEKAFIKNADELVYIGSGTSLTSISTAKKFAQKVSGIRISIYNPNEFLNDEYIYNPNAIYIIVSQTGNSVVTRNVLQFLQEKGYCVFAMSESADTKIAKDAKHHIDMGCGYEEYPTRTIGYTTTVFTSMLIAMQVAIIKENITQQEYDGYIEEAKASIANHRNVSDSTYEWLTFNKRKMLRSSCLLFVGSGELLPVAQEAAVKVWEIPQIPAFGYETEECLHGPNYGFNSTHCVIVLNGGGDDESKMMALGRYVKDIFKNGFIIGQQVYNDEDLLFTPKSDNFKFIEFSAAIQILAYRLADDGGRDLYAPHDNSVMESYFITHDESK
jgi:glucosamine 6-phosphate synthetase-like amidotransferase/phosphosugar isomerase protein